MLNKRFKIAKCKTSLKLATLRIKLMKNKKLIQINQMKRELAQLLDSGQDRTARIRVEHVIREEKMITAYDLIEIYCELIVARLPIIESQKTCPIDLKEAITSVIYAAPRCSEIPELVDARKKLHSKIWKRVMCILTYNSQMYLYPTGHPTWTFNIKARIVQQSTINNRFPSGPLFVIASVNRIPSMVEKLSAVAPDLQTKLQVLIAVAKKHNINWDPTLFEDTESKVSDDLLKEPVMFEEKLNRIYTLGTHNITSTDTNPSGMASEMMNRRHSFHNNSNNNSSSGKETNWDMGFKNATSATQAAAESAERASMAARAAAQLSSQGKHSSLSHQSPKASNSSRVPGQQHFKKSYNNSFKDRNPKIQNPQIDPSEEHDMYTYEKRKVGKRSVVDHENISRETINTSSYGDADRDDKSETDSDDDDENRKFDTGFEYDEGEAKSFFPSPGREESIRPTENSQNTHISSPKNNTRDKTDLQKVNSGKSGIQLNDFVKMGSSVYEDDDKRHEPKKKDDLDSENELKFGTLTGGLQNNGGRLKYAPYMKTGITDSSPSDDQASKPSSFNSRASRLEKKEQSVSRSSSESESDDRIEKYLESGSPFAPPESFFNDDEYADSDEEAQPVPKVEIGIEQVKGSILYGDGDGNRRYRLRRARHRVQSRGSILSAEPESISWSVARVMASRTGSPGTAGSMTTCSRRSLGNRFRKPSVANPD
ncbi:hypothetical protein LXL04_023777 [Taraxacum kok-saghyz]